MSKCHRGLFLFWCTDSQQPERGISLNDESAANGTS